MSVINGENKESTRWYSDRIQGEIQLVRWGWYGTPVLLFATAGGDAEECERFLMVRALAPLIDAGKIKLYSCNSVAGQTWLDESASGEYRAWRQLQFTEAVAHEIVPAIRMDCQAEGIDVVCAGASFGAFNSLAAICRHPELFSKAICMSGTFDLSRWMGGHWTEDYHHCSPLHFVPGLPEGPHLHMLQQRFALLASGQGQWEAPGECWSVANVLGNQQVPNRVDLWGPDVDHSWVTWRTMLPQYLAELVA